MWKVYLKHLERKIRIKKPCYLRIISKEENNLKILKKYLSGFYKIDSIVYKRKNGIGTIYYELHINKKENVQKLINLKIVKDIFNGD